MPEDNTGHDFSLKSGKKSILLHYTPVLHIRLPINPYLAQSKDDKFRLYSSDGKYERTLTIKDDKVDGDAFVDLIFSGLKVGLKYTLEIDPGAEGEKYNIFEDVPYQEIIDYYAMLEPGDDLEEEDEAEEDEGSDDDSDWEDEEDSEEEYGGDPDDDDDEMEAIIESEEPEETDLINWDTFDPSRGLGGSDSEDDEYVPEEAEW